MGGNVVHLDREDHMSKSMETRSNSEARGKEVAVQGILHNKCWDRG